MFFDSITSDGKPNPDCFDYYSDGNGTLLELDCYVDYISLLNDSLTDELIKIFHDEYQLGKRDSFDEYVKKIEADYQKRCRWYEDNKNILPPPTPLVSKLKERCKS